MVEACQHRSQVCDVSHGVETVQPNAVRYLPAPDAVERLWQAYARLDPGRATAATWDDEIDEWIANQPRAS